MLPLSFSTGALEIFEEKPLIAESPDTVDVSVAVCAKKSTQARIGSAQPGRGFCVAPWPVSRCEM